MEIEHRFINVTGNFDTDTDKIICVARRKDARVDLCFKANMHIPFAKIRLYQRDRFVDAEACFKSAQALGEEIERRWKLQAENEKLKEKLNDANHDYTELMKERADYIAENETLHKKLIILRNAKCPKCDFRFKIRKLS